MGVRIVAPNVVHCWLPSGFRVIRLVEADDLHVAAAVTCALGAHNSLWLASPTAFLRRVVVKAASGLQPFVLPEGFLCDASREDAFPHSDHVTRLRVGQVQSISAHVRTGRNDCSAASCRCVMEVFGTTGFAAVSFHDGTVDVAFDWDRVPDGTAFTHVVTSGRLLDAIRPAGFAAPVIFAITAAGRLRAAVGSSFLNVHDRKKWADGSCDVIGLCQTPVLLFSDPSNSFLVVLGCFRAGVVLYAGRGGKLATRRFVFKGGEGRLTRSAVRVVEEEDSKLVLEEVVHAHRTNISYDADEGTVGIDFDYHRAISRSKEEGSEDHSFAMRALLQGIEDLGEREKHYETFSRSTVDLITSYNAAILFATEWKTQCSPSDLVRSQRDACSVRAVVSDSAGHAHLRSSPSELGREILLIVSFRNKSQARLSEGWAVRVRLRKASVSTEWFSGKTEGYSTAFQEQGSKSDGSESTDIVRVMANPLPTVPSGGAVEVSFPVVVDSHAPLQASVSLHFRHPCANKITINSPDVELMLIEDELFDILDLSKISERGDLQDSHHGVLSSTSLAPFFNTAVSESRRAFSIVSRFNAPLSFEKATKVLNFIASSPQRETLLGAQYSLALAPSESHRINDEDRCSTVTIRGAAFVIPFVRAAVLRRLIGSGSIGQADLVGLPKASVSNSRRIHIAFSDEGAECLASFRRAECELSKIIRTYRDRRCQETLELWRDGNDREVMRHAILRARETYNFWRRQIEGL